MVLLLLPPSETKAPGGDGAPLDLAALTAPELTGVRTEIAESLVKLAGDVPAARTALGLSAKQDAEIARNAELLTATAMAQISTRIGAVSQLLGGYLGFIERQMARAAEKST